MAWIPRRVLSTALATAAVLEAVAASSPQVRAAVEALATAANQICSPSTAGAEDLVATEDLAVAVRLAGTVAVAALGPAVPAAR